MSLLKVSSLFTFKIQMSHDIFVLLEPKLIFIILIFSSSPSLSLHTCFLSLSLLLCKLEPSLCSSSNPSSFLREQPFLSSFLRQQPFTSSHFEAPFTYHKSVLAAEAPPPPRQWKWKRGNLLVLG